MKNIAKVDNTKIELSKRMLEMGGVHSLLMDLAGFIRDASLHEEDVVRMVRLLAVVKETARWAQGDILRHYRDQSGAMNAYRAGAKALDKSIRWAIELVKVADLYPEKYRLFGLEWHAYRKLSVVEDHLEAIQKLAAERFSSKDGEDANA